MYRLIAVLLIFSFLNFGGFAEEKKFLETLGYVSAQYVYVRKEPSTDSKALYKLRMRAKLEILAKEGDWYKVKYSRTRVGYIHSDYVTFKEGNISLSIDKGNVEKKFRVEITKFADTFNKKVQDSKIFDNYQVAPQIRINKSLKKDDIMMLELLYTGKDSAGKITSSQRDNPLAKVMKQAVEVILFKMMLSKAEKYVIEVKVPEFTDGAYAGVYKTYTTIEVETNTMDLESVKNIDGKIWDYVKTTVPHQILFAEFPR